MNIYIDVILIENLCMNFIILMATGIVCKVKNSYIKLFISALLGAAYAVVSILNVLPNIIGFILKILLSMCMMYIAFNPPKVKTLVKELIIFYLVSFAFGGCAFYLLYFIKPQDILIKDGVYIGTYPLKIAIMGGILGFVVVNIAFKVIKGRITKKDLFCDVKILFDSKEVTIKALIDTGNLLKDPLSGMSVIVVELEKIKKILPLDIIKSMNCIMGGETNCEVESKYMSKFRVVPFSSLGKQNGMLISFIADKVIVCAEEGEKEVSKVLIGIYDKLLTKNRLYSGLIGIDILERCDKNEFFAIAKK